MCRTTHRGLIAEDLGRPRLCFRATELTLKLRVNTEPDTCANARHSDPGIAGDKLAFREIFAQHGEQKSQRVRDRDGQ